MSTSTMSNKEKAALDKLKSWKPSAWSRSTEGAEPMDYRKLAEAPRQMGADEVSDEEFAKQLSNFYSELLSKQEPLGAEFEKVFSDNLDKLYIRSDDA